jgi:hypothetical protein
VRLLDEIVAYFFRAFPMFNPNPLFVEAPFSIFLMLSSYSMMSLKSSPPSELLFLIVPDLFMAATKSFLLLFDSIAAYDRSYSLLIEAEPFRLFIAASLLTPHCFSALEESIIVVCLRIMLAGFNF